MAGARTVTSLAGYTRNQLVQLKRRVEQRRGAMTAKAVFRFIAVNVSPPRRLQARWRVERIPDRPIQSVDGRVIAHAALVELSVVAEDIRLGDARIPERIKNRFTQCFFSVGHAIQLLPALTHDFERVLSRSKSHPGVRPQHVAFRGSL